MVIICFIPIIGSAIVFLLTWKKLVSAKKWIPGYGITVFFGFLYLLSWIIAAFLALACEALFNITDEAVFLPIIIGFTCILSPWSALGYHIKVEKFIYEQATPKNIIEDD